MINAYIGITDERWFATLRGQPNLDEVNFWLPTGRSFKALQPGELFLFKLHSPKHYIVGGGIFCHYSRIPVSMAWEAFGVKNGAESLEELKLKIARHRQGENAHQDDFYIGCVILEQPFFLTEEKWIPAPPDWSPSIQSGKRYDLSREPGLTILRQLQRTNISPQLIREERARYGEPTTVLPRLGQGAFRVLVTDAYERHCAISGEKILPVLDAAHIKSYKEGGEHLITNGVLLRQDIHTLFDKGYLTITPEYRVEVSRRLKDEFDNGKEYFRFQGQPISLPRKPEYRPDRDFLAWHNQNIYEKG
jgi:putative restriction endonuclease